MLKLHTHARAVLARAAGSTLAAFTVLVPLTPVGADTLDDFPSGPGHIATIVEIITQFSVCSGWTLYADVSIDDSEIGWVSDLTANLLPIVSLEDMGIGDISPEQLPSFAPAIRSTYGQLHPGADEIFIVATDCEAEGTLTSQVSLAGLTPRLSESRCGTPAALAMSVNAYGGNIGDFAIGVRFTGNRFRRHVCISTINSFSQRITHGWLSFYPAVGEVERVGFYPEQYGKFYGRPGVMKDEPIANYDHWDARICFPVSQEQYEDMWSAVLAVDQSPPHFNLTSFLGASSNCMDVARSILDVGEITAPSMESARFPFASAPFAFGDRLEKLGHGAYFGCGQVELPQGGTAAAGAGPTGLYDIGPDALVAWAAIPPGPPGQPSPWPPDFPLSTIPGGDNPFIPVAAGSTINLTVQSDAVGAAVAVTNNVDFFEIVDPGDTIEFEMMNPFGEVLVGGIVSPGGFQQFQFTFIVLPGPAPEGPMDIVLDAPSLPQVMPIVEPGLAPAPDPDPCIYDCDADGIADCATAPDCNGNGVPDLCDIMLGTSVDSDNDGVPDDCGGCSGDTNGDGAINVNDLNNVILDWGSDGSANGGDLTGVIPGSPPDGVVNVNDLNAVIVGWGMCP